MLELRFSRATRDLNRSACNVVMQEIVIAAHPNGPVGGMSNVILMHQGVVCAYIYINSPITINEVVMQVMVATRGIFKLNGIAICITASRPTLDEVMVNIVVEIAITVDSYPIVIAVQTGTVDSGPMRGGRTPLKLHI